MASVYHTSVRTLDELGQAAGRLLALQQFLAEYPDRKRCTEPSSCKARPGHLHIRKIQKMQWAERSSKRGRHRTEYRAEFWLDVVVLEPHVLEGVPLPWMLAMDELEPWLSMQPEQPTFLGQVRGANKSPNSAAACGHISPTMALLVRLCQAADMINEHHRGPSAYLSCVPRYSLAAGKIGAAERRARHKEYGISSNEKIVLEGLEQATSTRVGNLSIVFYEWLQGAASPPSPPLSSQESDGSDAALPSGEEWPSLGTSPRQEHEALRVWPVNSSRVPKINAVDVQRMARVRNAGLIWDSLYTEVNLDDGKSWATSSRSQRVARSPLATVSVVCTI